MKLEKLYLKNFKSIKSSEINFTNKSIILGANASGKSNLISALKLINYILTYGIDDAVSLLGGIDNIFCINTNPDEYLELKFTIVLDNNDWYSQMNKIYGLKPIKLDYLFRLTKKTNNQFNVIHDEFILFSSLIDDKKKKVKDDNKEVFGNFATKFIKNGKKFSCTIVDNSSALTDKELMSQDFFKLFSLIMKDARKELMLNTIRYILPPIYFTNNEIFKIYDFDPKLLKTPSQITSKRSLEEDGANIGVVLEALLSGKKDKSKLFNILNSCLPNIQSVQVKKNIDKSVSYQMIESYYNKPLYSQFLSDGTVSMLALIISLYFNEEENIIVLEEPERNLHPKVIRKLVDMLNEVSKDKQIIITTHNSEIVKNSALEDIICVKREQNGITNISRPITNARVNVFLQNELGLEDLFLDGII